MTQATLGFLGFDYGLNAASKSKFDSQVASLARGLKPLEIQVKADAKSAAAIIRSLSAPVSKTLTINVDPASLAAARAALRGLGTANTITLRLDPTALTAVSGLVTGLSALNTTLTTLNTNLGNTSNRIGGAAAATSGYAQQMRVLAAEEKAGLLTGQQHLTQLQGMQAAMQSEIATLQNLGVRTAAQTAELNNLRQSYAGATTAINRLKVEQSTEVQAAGTLVGKLRELNQQRQNGSLRNREYIAQATALRTQIQNEAQALGSLTSRTAAQQRAYDLLSAAAKNATSGINNASGANLRAAHSSRMAAAAIGSGLVQSLTMTLGPGGMVIGMLTSLTAGMTGASVAAKLLTGIVGGTLLGLGLAAAAGVKQNTELTKSYNILRANGVEDIQAVDRELVNLRNTGGLVMQTFKRTELAQTTAELVKAGADVKSATTELATGAKLASAEEKNLNETTLSLHRNLTQFGLGAQDAARSGDMLAKASNLAYTDATGLSKGLNTVGATAKLAGFSFAETLGALVELDNKGFDAADVGATGLRGALAALADPSIKAQGLLNGMKISLQNTDGTARSTKLVMKDLRDWIVKQGVSVNQNTKDLEGNAEALSKVSGIMDTRAAAAMLMLTNEWDKNTQQIQDSNGFLDQYANTMSQGVGPAMKRLTSTAAEFGTELTRGTMGGLNLLIDGLNSAMMTAMAFARAWNEVNEAVGKGKSWDEAVSRFPQFAAGLTAIHRAQELVKGGVTWFNQNMPLLTAAVGGLTIAWGLNFIAGGGLATLWTTRMLPGILALGGGIRAATASSLAFLATPVGGFAVIAGAVAALALAWFNLRKEIDATYDSIQQGQKDSDAQLDAGAARAEARGTALGKQQATVLRLMKELNQAERDVIVGKDIWGNPKYAKKDDALIKSLQLQLAQEKTKLNELARRPENQPEAVANQQAAKLLAEQQRLNTELGKAQKAGDAARQTRLNAQIAEFGKKVESFRAESAVNAAALKTLEDAQAARNTPARGTSDYAATQQKLYQQASNQARQLLAEQTRLNKEIAAAQKRGDSATTRGLQTTLAQLNGKIAQFKAANTVQKEAMNALQKTGGDTGTSGTSTRAARTDTERIAWDKWVRSLKTATTADLQKAQSQAELNKQYNAWKAIQTELDARAGRDKQAAERRRRELAQEAQQVANLTRDSGQLVRRFAEQVGRGQVTADGLNTFTNQIEDLQAKLKLLPAAAQKGFASLLTQAGQLKGQAQAIVNHTAAVRKLKDVVGDWSSTSIQSALARSKDDSQKQAVLKAALKQAQTREAQQFRELVEKMAGSGKGKEQLTALLNKPGLSAERAKVVKAALDRLQKAELSSLKNVIGEWSSSQIQTALDRVGKSDPAKRKALLAAQKQAQSRELNEFKDWVERVQQGGQGIEKLSETLKSLKPGDARYKVVETALKQLKTQELNNLKGWVEKVADAGDMDKLQAVLERVQPGSTKAKTIQAAIDKLHKQELSSLKEAVQGWSMSEVEAGIERAQGDPGKLKILQARLGELQKVHTEVMREVASTAAELSRQAADAVVASYEERKQAAGENLVELYNLEVETGHDVLRALNEQARLEREARDQRIRDDADSRRIKAAPLGQAALYAVDTAEQTALLASQTQFDNQVDKNQQAVNGRRTAAQRKFMAAIRSIEATARREILQNTVDTLQAQTTELENKLQDQVSAEGLSAKQRLDIWQQNSYALIRNKSEELAAIAALQRSEEELRYSQETASAENQGTLDALTEVRKDDGNFYTVRELLLRQHTSRMTAINTKFGNDLHAYTVKLGKDVAKAEKDVFSERVDTVRSELDKMFAALDEGSGQVRSQLRVVLNSRLAEFKALGQDGAAGVKLVEDALNRLTKADVSAAKSVDHLLDPKKFAAFQAGQQLDLDKLQGKDTAAGARATAASPFESKAEEIQGEIDKLNNWWLGLGRTEQLAQEAGYLQASSYLQGVLGGLKTQAEQAGTRAADYFVMSTNLRLSQASSKQSGEALRALFVGGAGGFADVEKHLATLRTERDAAAQLVAETAKTYGEGSDEHKKAVEAWVQAEQAATADLTTELDQRQQLNLQSAEASRKIQEKTGVGSYQTYVNALAADRDYHTQKVAWLTKTYGATHALTLKGKVDLDNSTAALLDAIEAPSLALAEFRKQADAAEGKKTQPFKAEIDGLEQLKLKYPDLSREVDALIVRYEKLRRVSGIKERVQEIGQGIQSWTSAISSVMNAFGTDDSRALGGIAEGVGAVAESAMKFAAGDIAGGISAAFSAVLKLGDSILSLDPAFKKMIANWKEVAKVQEDALGGKSGALKNPFSDRLKKDFEARQQLINANFLQRLWWNITGTTPEVLDDAAAKTLAEAKTIFDQLGESLTSTFENSLLDAWSKGDLSNLQKAFEDDLNKQIAQMVVHEAAQIVLASEKIQTLVKQLGEAIKNRDVQGVKDIGKLLSEALAEGAQDIGDILSGLPGFGLGADLNSMLNQQYTLHVNISAETDPAKLAKLKSDLADLDRRIKDVAFKNLGGNIFTGMRDAWKASLGEMLAAGSFSSFKTQMSQNMKKAVMGAIIDAVTASVDMAGTLQPIITRLVEAIRSGDKEGRSKAISDLKGAIRGILTTTKSLFSDLNSIQKELGLDTSNGLQTTAKGQVEWDTPQMRLTLDGMALLARTLDTQIPALEGAVGLFGTATKLYDAATTRLDTALSAFIPRFDSGIGKFLGGIDRFDGATVRFDGAVNRLAAAAGSINRAAAEGGGGSSGGGSFYWTPKK